VNSFKNFKVNQAKQFVACTHDGHVIGDAILFFLDENRLSLVGRPSALNWVEYHAASGAYKVTTERDERSFVNRVGRKMFRFQVQGPHAGKVIEKVTGKVAPDIKFFNIGMMTIAGNEVRALRHGMVGQPGWELFGPWAQAEAVRAALVEAGREYGMRQVGARTYPTSCLESGWIPSPLPAVYTGEKLKPYRQWLSSKSYESMASLGGSFVSEDIRDYYLTPYDLGYGPFVKFDHDFIGREALEKVAGKPHRRKVTFAWNPTDAGKVLTSFLDPDGSNYKFFDLPLANYSSSSYDKVLKNGKVVGLSMFSGYSYNERSVLSLGVLDPGVQIGDVLTLVWGEENGGSKKTTVERHKQIEIRAIVSPVPYSKVAREEYASGWRTGNS
jgi:vanillate/3-O-methylgallate O-demethylase